MDLGTYYAYWQKYMTDPELVKSIKNIDIFDLEETLSYIKKQGAGMHLAIEDPSVGTGGNSVDNVLESYVGAVVILGKLNIRKDKAAERNQLLVDTFAIAQQIKIQMLKDAEAGCGMLHGLQYNRFELDKVGPLGDSLYGWRLQFELRTSLTYS